MPKTQLSERLGQIPRLVGVDPSRTPRLDVAKSASPGTGITQDHHRRVALRPTLSEVRAGGLLADGIQPLPAHQRTGRLEGGLRSRAQPHADPRRLASDGGVVGRRHGLPIPDRES